MDPAEKAAMAAAPISSGWAGAGDCMVVFAPFSSLIFVFLHRTQWAFTFQIGSPSTGTIWHNDSETERGRDVPESASHHGPLNAFNCHPVALFAQVIYPTHLGSKTHDAQISSGDVAPDCLHGIAWLLQRKQNCLRERKHSHF